MGDPLNPGFYPMGNPYNTVDQQRVEPPRFENPYYTVNSSETHLNPYHTANQQRVDPPRLYNSYSTVDSSETPFNHYPTVNQQRVDPPRLDGPYHTLNITGVNNSSFNYHAIKSMLNEDQSVYIPPPPDQLFRSQSYEPQPDIFSKKSPEDRPLVLTFGADHDSQLPNRTPQISHPEPLIQPSYASVLPDLRAPPISYNTDSNKLPNLPDLRGPSLSYNNSSNKSLNLPDLGPAPSNLAQLMSKNASLVLPNLVPLASPAPKELMSHSSETQNPVFNYEAYEKSHSFNYPSEVINSSNEYSIQRHDSWTVSNPAEITPGYYSGQYSDPNLEVLRIASGSAEVTNEYYSEQQSVERLDSFSLVQPENPNKRQSINPDLLTARFTSLSTKDSNYEHQDLYSTQQVWPEHRGVYEESNEVLSMSMKKSIRGSFIVKKSYQKPISPFDFPTNKGNIYPLQVESNIPLNDIETAVETISKTWIKLELMKELARFKQSFINCIDQLRFAHNIVAWKKSRGDGNCYYRAVITRYFEIIFGFYSPIQNCETFQKILQDLSNSLKHKPGLDYSYTQSIAYITNCVEELIKIKARSSFDCFRTVLKWLQFSELDLNLVRVARLICYNVYLKQRQIWEEVGVYSEATAHDILAMGTEAEGLILVLLPMGLEIQVVQYNVFERINVEKFPEESSDSVLVHIIRRTGHYDILYTTEECEQDMYSLDTGRYHCIYKPE